MTPQPFPYSVNFRGYWACPCLAEWLPWFEKYLRFIGVLGPNESLNFYQLIGGASQSSNTHLSGGDWDIHHLIKFVQTQLAAAQMGSWLEHRLISQGFDVEHDHGSLNGCPHESSAAKNQDVEFAAGQDGLLDHVRDGHPPVTRTWQQGIAWAKATILKETTVLTLVDAAWNRPTPAAVKAAGHAGIIGYVSDFPSKNITKAECTAFIADGLSVTPVWEDGAGNALMGAAKGIADAAAAIRQGKALGCSKGTPLIATCDTSPSSTTEAKVAPYAKAFAAAVRADGWFIDMGYGPDFFTKYFTLRWRPETWGSDSVNMTQLVNPPIPGPMPGCDVNRVDHDFPRWSAAFIAKAAAADVPPALHQTMRELVMQIHETPASNEWGRRARIAYNLLCGRPGALVGHVTTAEPVHITNARTDLAGYIPGVSAGDQWGKRARLAYNALRGIN